MFCGLLVIERTGIVACAAASAVAGKAKQINKANC